MRRAWPVAAVAIAVAVALSACGGGKSAAPKTPAAGAVALQPLGSASAAASAGPPAPAPARSHLVGTIERRALGPFTARAPDGGLVAWIVSAERGGGEELVVVPTGIDGAPLAAPKTVAKVPQEVTSLVVRRAGGSRGGWLVMWSALLDRGEALSIVGLAPDGTARVGPLDVQRTSDHVKWADAVPGPHGSTCVWAEETPAGDANMLSVPLDTDGRPRGMPVRVARSVSGWAAVGAVDGVGLALVTSSPNDRSAAGSLSWLRLDGEGHPASAPVAIGARPTVSGDVDVVPVAGGWLLAWTDATGEDAQVTLATVDAAGKVRGPRRAMDAVGGTRLVGLAAGPAGVALAWEEPRGRAREMHALHVAGVVTEGEPAAQPVAAFDVDSRVAPELVATEHGFALVAAAHACTAGAPGDACEGPVVPTFLRLDARLAPEQAEPLLLGPSRSAAALGWGVHCEGDRCVVLGATGESPTPIYSVDLAPRASPFAVPVTPAPPRDAPRVMGVTTLASGAPYSDLASARVGESTLVASLTTSVDAPSRKQRKREVGAAVAVRAFDDRGQPLAPSDVLTTRAISVGGVSIAAGGRPEDGALVGWVARDGGDPQVHLTHVDRKGKRVNEMQLTTTHGDASDVVLAWCGDGWLVAWVDARDGNGEVYATKVDRDLKRTAREERITNAPGDAGDLALAVKGDTAWLAWSDPRESPRDATGDIYATTLSVRDARRASEESRVLSTAAHSRSPQIVPAGDGAIVAWIEDAPTGLEGPGAAMVARLDARARVAGKPVSLPAAARGRPTALALSPAGVTTRVILARNDQDDVTLDAVTLSPEGTPGRPWRLLDLDAPGSFDVTVVLAGDAVFFDDIGATPSEHRVRRAAISWGR
jgi:hypothetical protein